VLPIAHAGHWAIWILYAVPVVIVLGSIVVQLRRGRREDPAGSEDEPADL
jgi:cytochrome c-type biogenesis protein CcmH/NrfF